ncbi:hypothetical protein BLNAU_7885 [Blattamonas nauphoetae]|uniref:Uncharacterized protein n=1 Tax=Blattamonas nauphoetae TaxID=2049346 RepID=A0ABQ9Y014_9EUKA|nr:hypothetical protein BLNAU_7885 [Blattamonas nauphoetae]
MDRVSSREDTASDSAIGSIRPKHSVPTIFSTTHGGHSIRKQNVSIPKSNIPSSHASLLARSTSHPLHTSLPFHACLFNVSQNDGNPSCHPLSAHCLPFLLESLQRRTLRAGWSWQDALSSVLGSGI